VDPEEQGRLKALSWELSDAPIDRAEITVLCAVHEYLTVERVSVRETEHEVRVTIVGRLDPPSGGWTSYGEKEPQRIKLERPLGDRVLLG
jgi:hypothetical protein